MENRQSEYFCLTYFSKLNRDQIEKKLWHFKDNQVTRGGKHCRKSRKRDTTFRWVLMCIFTKNILLRKKEKNHCEQVKKRRRSKSTDKPAKKQKLSKQHYRPSGTIENLSKCKLHFFIFLKKCLLVVAKTFFFVVTKDKKQTEYVDFIFPIHSIGFVIDQKHHKHRCHSLFLLRNKFCCIFLFKSLY